MLIIDDSTVKIYQQGIDSIRTQLGRFFSINSPNAKTVCPNCGGSKRGRGYMHTEKCKGKVI